MDNNKNTKKKGTNWIGWLIFFTLVFGPNIIRPVSQIISQATSGTVNIGVNIIPGIIGGLAIVMVLTSILRAAARYSKRNETTLPTTLSSPSSSSSSTSFPSWSDMASGTTLSTTSSSTHSEWLQPSRHNQHTTDDVDKRFESIFDDKDKDKDKDEDDDKDNDTEQYRGFSRPRQRTPTRWNDVAPPARFEPVISGKAILAALVTFMLVGGGLAFGGILSRILP